MELIGSSQSVTGLQGVHFSAYPYFHRIQWTCILCRRRKDEHNLGKISVVSVIISKYLCSNISN